MHNIHKFYKIEFFKFIYFKAKHCLNAACIIKKRIRSFTVLLPRQYLRRF